MNENADKHLDELSRKVMRHSTIEHPSIDFTQNVMSQVENIATSDVTTYVPLISKRLWFLIITALVAIGSLAFFGIFNNSNSWFDRLPLDRISEYSFPNPFATIEFSQTVLYAALLFAIMMCIQIPILKRYFDKRLEV